MCSTDYELQITDYSTIQKGGEQHMQKTLLKIGSGLMVAGATLLPLTVHAEAINVYLNELSAPLGFNAHPEDLRVIIANIIRVAMGLLGIVAVVIILIGGFTWMTAGGSEEKVEKAKAWIGYGIVGLAVILSAYAIATFVISSLLSATGAV